MGYVSNLPPHSYNHCHGRQKTCASWLPMPRMTVASGMVVQGAVTCAIIVAFQSDEGTGSTGRQGRIPSKARCAPVAQESGYQEQCLVSDHIEHNSSRIQSVKRKTPVFLPPPMLSEIQMEGHRIALAVGRSVHLRWDQTAPGSNVAVWDGSRV